MASSFWETSERAWSQLSFCHLPPSSFIGYLRRCESCVMPCSRTEAPLAQCAPRLIGESNTGSCRIQTPSCTTASMAQPTEQCVHTVRLTSILPLVCSTASAVPIIENGSCAATAPAPTVTPERCRNARRSMVFAGTIGIARDRRAWGTAWLLALRVRSIAGSSNLGGAVVVADVLARVITASCALALAGDGQRRRGLRHDRRRGGRAARAERQQEIPAGKFGFFMDHVVDRKSTRLNSSHTVISYAVFCLKKKRHSTEDDFS